MDKEKELINVIDKMTGRIGKTIDKDSILKYLLTLPDKEFDDFIHKVRKKRRIKWTPHKDAKIYEHKVSPTDDSDGPRYDIKLGV